MPTIRDGQLATDEVLAGQKVIDMSSRVFLYDPPGNPYTHIMTDMLGRNTAKSTKHEWMEDEPVPYWDQLNEALDTSETDILVDNPTYFSPGDLVKVTTTDEVMRVTARTATSIVVTRAWAGSATAAADNDYIINLSAAQMEGDVSPDARATVKVGKFNYTQIVKTPVHITNTNSAIKHYHGDEFAFQRRKAAELHGRRWEEIAFHGRKVEDLSSFDKPVRSAGGLNEIISTYELDTDGPMTESRFIDFMEGAFRYSVSGSRMSKILFASGEIISTINSWGLAKLQFNDGLSGKYKVHVQDYSVGGYSLRVIRHKLLENGYAGWGFIVDPEGAKYCALQGRDTKLHRNIQDPSEDGMKDEYRTEATFQFALEKVHARIRDVTF